MNGYVVYGGGEVGNQCCDRLRKGGHEVCYGLDKMKCGEDIIQGIYTYSLGTEPKEDKDKLTVIICLTDGLLHKGVGDKLFDHGYRRIVFLPISFCIPDKAKRELTRQYNRFLQADSNLDNEIIEDYSKYITPNLEPSNSILRDYGDTVITWCGIEMLFTESLELWKGDLAKVHGKDEYKDKSIAISNPVKSLFDYFAMNENNPERYFNSKKEPVSDDKMARVLSAREELYDVFEREYDRGMDFFIEGAPCAIWNPKHYWNLVGGHHRTTYLLHKGHTFFPIRVARSDFDEWANEIEKNRLCEHINANGIDRFYAPVPHPGFLNFPSKYENREKVALEAVLSYFGFPIMCKMSEYVVLDAVEDEGYFARVMSRCGAIRAVFMSVSQRQREAAGMLNKVLFREEVEVVDEVQDGDQFDIVFCEESAMEKYIHLCKEIMIVERTSEDSGDVGQHGGESKVIFREYRKGKYHSFVAYNTKETA